MNNIAAADNVWSFDTLRPDGVAREVSSDISSDGEGMRRVPRTQLSPAVWAKDTARSQGFFLYPYELLVKGIEH
jgi:hypothetical protein